MEDIKMLMKLKKIKLELMDIIVYYDLEKEENYKKAKEKYEEYKMIYKKITGKEPKNSFESLIELKSFED